MDTKPKSCGPGKSGEEGLERMAGFEDFDEWIAPRVYPYGIKGRQGDACLYSAKRGESNRVVRAPA